MRERPPNSGSGEETTDGIKPLADAELASTELASEDLPAKLAEWEARLAEDAGRVSDSVGIVDPDLVAALKKQAVGGDQAHLADELGIHDSDATDAHPAAQNPTVTQGDRLEAPRRPSIDPAADSSFIGRYEVKSILGQGGYGRVYLAYDAELERLVAIKIPLFEKFSEFVDVQSYLEEARMLARLSHPNIVPVYDVGRTKEGSCYVVSRYIDGGDLANRIAVGRLSTREATTLIAALADALHYTHTHDLFHRDIKPANILIDSSGNPCLADFGLALKDENHGQGAGMVGTTAYMSPEQARGEGHLVDGRSDIFSLGIVFYELLTGRRPFRGRSREEVLHKIITEEPRPPRQIDDKIPRELERICLKALSKRAAERYSTAKDLADDLRHALELVDLEQRSLRPAEPSLYSPSASPGDRTASHSLTSRLGRSDSLGHGVTIVPKGLGSFDEQDAEFFLELLPGPRDRHGLPDGLRFWKAKIEADDPDKSFRVGIIYGPSGCGKSSFVKAGLLPLVERDRRVRTVYIEAAGADTEARLLHAIGKTLPGVNNESGLAPALAAIRRGRYLASGSKLLLVIDQLEQWLFANHGDQKGELVDALRQCDGDRLQAICLVRDDFWMATTRFMRQLEIDLVPDQNVAAVDLFDPKHARKVLAAYGRAYGAIAMAGGEIPKEQASFLDQAVTGLAQEGTVVPVRLALFAEMIKGKTWAPATLREMGGADGVGVKFLEETFSSARSSPKYRYHQAAAQAVLKALLPETNADIKGQMRSIDELRAVSGYGDRDNDFAELIRVLDTELRLITPVDRAGSFDDGDHTIDGPPAGLRSYQLTHDYLVGSLREWLSRKERETRRGRAQLLLAERANLWGAKQSRRFLPSTLEWISISLQTNRRDWTDVQRKMMRRTARLIALEVVIATAAVAGLYVGGLAINGRMIEVQNVTHARGLIERLLMADTTQVPAIVAELAGYRRWTDSALATIVAESAPGTKRRLHASLALLPVRPDQIDYLRGSLASADPPAAKVLAASLRPHQARLVDTLWKELRSARPGDPRFLPTASLLADYDPASSAWADVSVPLAEEMVKAHVDDVKGWMEALWNVRSYLIDPLEAIYRKKDRPEIDQTIATTLLARYAADQPRFIVDLLLDAKPPSFAILFPVIRDDAEVAVPELSSAIDRAMADPGGEPDPAASDEVATRSSRAAVALLELGHDEKVWRLLAYKPDPIARSSLIDALPAYRVPIDGLVRELDRLRTNGSGKPMQPGANQAPNQSYLFDPGTSLLRGILQALAGYPADEMAPLGKRNLCAKVLEIHATNPDAGVHSAAELLLRRWGEGRAVRETPDAPAIAATSPRRWSVNQAGLTMVLIDGPVEFTMGSPPSDPERENGDIRHSRKIPRAFAIASREVTIRQYEAFATATNRPMPQYSRRYSPDKGGPQIKVDWFDAALYCNWLSRAEHLQPCYERTKSTSGADLTFNFNAAAAAQGAYRLPTEAEWEYACRAGTTSCRFYGHNPLLLKNYEWYVENSGDRAHPGGLLLPNDLGLFDTLGNVAEWCHDRWHDSTINFAMPIDDILVDETMPRAHRHHRGQTFHDTPSTVRAGTRTWINPTEPRNDIGFRPARTIPARGH